MSVVLVMGSCVSEVSQWCCHGALQADSVWSISFCGVGWSLFGSGFGDHVENVCVSDGRLLVVLSVVMVDCG